MTIEEKIAIRLAEDEREKRVIIHGFFNDPEIIKLRQRSAELRSRRIYHESSAVLQNQLESEHRARCVRLFGSESLEFSTNEQNHAHGSYMNRIESAVAEYYGMDCYKLAF